MLMMIVDIFVQVFTNRIFLTVVITYFLAQIIKSIIHFFEYRRADGEKKEQMIRSQYHKRRIARIALKNGGMPSSHAASTGAVCTSLLLVEGPNSRLFLFSIFVAAVIVSDALGVRRQVGVVSHKINEIINYCNVAISNMEKEATNQNNRKQMSQIKVVLGHTPLEVFFGFLLGISIAVVSHLLFFVS